MKHVVKRIESIALMLALVLSLLPMKDAKAYSDAAIWYHSIGGVEHYCECIDQALMFCHKNGGQIILNQSRHFDFPKELAYAEIRENTTLIVREKATLTIGGNGFKMDGSLQVFGTVDMEHSDGLLYGDGEIQMKGGKMIKKSYSINQNGSDVCLEGKDIVYGQRLADSEFLEDRINWRSSVEGNWEFCQPDLTPQAGTNYYDLVFKPAYPLTYEEKVFARSAKVTTKKIVPSLQKYETVEISAGQSLLDVNPEVEYICPFSGEKVEGEFSFDQSDQILSETGEHMKKGTFVPLDDNYEQVSGFFKILVKDTEPEVAMEPQIRGQGTYGQTLADIRFLPGKCVNPYNGKAINGTWEWKDATERLQLGTGKYVIVFLPSEDSYLKKELEIEVTTNPKVMDDIEWPSCSDLDYGERVADSKLSFEKNEYGTFAWENENIYPGVKNNGVGIVFHPARTDTYDWSRLAGYDAETGTITFTIPIHVRPIIKALPEIKASDIDQDTCVSGSALSLDASEGTAEWKEPEQIADQSGWYPVYFTPLDSDNYDWSSYYPDEQGRIPMQVYVKVIEKEIPATPEPEETKGPEETEEDLKPTENSESSPGQSKEEAPVVTEGERTTFLITQMVSKASKVNGQTVKATKFVKGKRKGKCIKLAWKKVNGATYQIQYGTSKKWKKAKKKSVKGTSVTLTKLNSKKKYYVRIRCLKKRNGENCYSQWSAKKKF